MFLSFFILLKICRFLRKDDHEKVKKIIPYSLGFLSCLYGSCNFDVGQNKSYCKLFLNTENEKHRDSVDAMLQGFWCSKCDGNFKRNRMLHWEVVHQPSMQDLETVRACDFIGLQSLYFDLLYDESSEEVQLACLEVMQRVLLHGTGEILLRTRSEWIKCFKFLLLNRNKVIREAFCTQINCFLQDPILSCLFIDGSASNKSCEQIFIDIIKHALSASEDLHIFETLMESAAEVMMAVDINSHLFLFSLILLVDQLDNPHIAVRINASRLIHKSCYFHVKGGFELLLSKAVHIRNELFDYLSMRIATRANMVREFAEAVFGIETEKLIEKMVPVILPKLLVSQKDNDQAVDTLYEVAKCLNTDVVPLIVNWLPKVLAFALHQSDEKHLVSALQFYHTQTGSDNQEIFAAALPALLDELICFVDVADASEINRRYATLDQVTSFW